MHKSTMNRQKTNILIACLAAMLLVLACGVPVAPTPAFTSPPPGSLETMIIETAGAAQTRTIMAIPPTKTLTATVPPTRTPTNTLTPTETVVIILPTETPSPTDTPGPIKVGDVCELISQDPGNNTRLSPKLNFDMRWTFKNTGGDIWTAGDFDFQYISGAKIHKVKRYDLPTSVEPGNEVTLTVKMRTPEEKGVYSATWGLLSGKTSICKVTYTIFVE